MTVPSSLPSPAVRQWSRRRVGGDFAVRAAYALRLPHRTRTSFSALRAANTTRQRGSLQRAAGVSTSDRETAAHRDEARDEEQWVTADAIADLSDTEKAIESRLSTSNAATRNDAHATPNLPLWRNQRAAADGPSDHWRGRSDESVVKASKQCVQPFDDPGARLSRMS
jgi:hypothetical protein